MLYAPNPQKVNSSLFPPFMYISTSTNHQTQRIPSTKPQASIGIAASTQIESKKKKKPKHNSLTLIVQTKLSIPASRDSCTLQEVKIQLRWPSS